MSRKTIVLAALLAALCAPAWGANWPLPAADAAGYRQVGAVTTYNSDNLFEYINGDAETFFGFGFGALAVAKYASQKDNVLLTINLYDMQTTLSAFGVYANGRSAGLKFVDVGAQGYLGENALDFWKGRYYVRVLGPPDAKTPEGALLALGQMVAEKIEGLKGEPPESGILPAEGRVENSIRYQPHNALGQSFIGNAFMADYDLGGARVQLLVSQCPSEAEALKSLEGLKDYVKNSGAVAEQDAGSFFGNDPYYKNLLAVVRGSCLVCVLRAPDRPAAQKLLETYLNHKGH